MAKKTAKKTDLRWAWGAVGLIAVLCVAALWIGQLRREAAVADLWRKEQAAAEQRERQARTLAAEQREQAASAEVVREQARLEANIARIRDQMQRDGLVVPERAAPPVVAAEPREPRADPPVVVAQPRAAFAAVQPIQPAKGGYPWQTSMDDAKVARADVVQLTAVGWDALRRGDAQEAQRLFARADALLAPAKRRKSVYLLAEEMRAMRREGESANARWRAANEPRGAARTGE